MSKWSRDDDLIKLVERIVRTTEEQGEEDFTIPTLMARALLEMAKQAKPEGRRPVSGRNRVYEAHVVALARSHKRKLIDGGMPKGEAHDKAAEWAMALLRKRRNLDKSTIARRMQRRRPVAEKPTLNP